MGFTKKHKDSFKSDGRPCRKRKARASPPPVKPLAEPAPPLFEPEPPLFEPEPEELPQSPPLFEPFEPIEPLEPFEPDEPIEAFKPVEPFQPPKYAYVTGGRITTLSKMFEWNGIDRFPDELHSTPDMPFPTIPEGLRANHPAMIFANEVIDPTQDGL